METIVVVGLPVLIILAIVISLKLRAWLSFLLIFVLGLAAPFVVDFVYCTILTNECPPDALAAVAFLFHAQLVIVISCGIYAFILNNVKRDDC